MDFLDDPDMGRRTIWTDLNKIARVEELGLDVTKLFNATIDLALSEEFEDLVVQGKLRKIDSDLQEISMELKRMEERKSLLLKQRHDMETTKQDIEGSWEQTKARVYKAQYIRTLNQIIIINKYNQEVVESVAGDLIKSITRLEPDFQLQPHMVGLKKMMRH